MHQQFNEVNRNILVNINGELMHRDRAGISPFDSSVQNGDAVWEGLRLYEGRIFRLHEHLDRLRASAQALQYVSIPSHEAIIEQLRRTLAANHMTDGVHIRLTLTRGVKYTSGLDPRVNLGTPTLIILAEHKPPVYSTAGIRLITSMVRRPPPEVLNQHIHSSNQLTSILAKIEANAAGVDDALMLDTRGYVAETNATHLFMVKNSQVHTPTCFACPKGITRAVVLETCLEQHIPAHERDITLNEFLTADEVFCTGTMGEIVPVVEIDFTAIGPSDRAPGTLTSRLITLFRDRTRREGFKMVG